MVSNVISIRKVKLRKKAESLKEFMYSPLTLFNMGLVFIAGLGIYTNYYLTTRVLNF